MLTTVPVEAQTPNGPRGLRQPSAIASGQSIVKGRVVYKDTQQPLKGVGVRVFTGGDSGGRGLVAFTNNNGEFQISGLAAGKYYVTLEGTGTAMRSGFGMKIPLPVTAIPRKEDFAEIVPRHDAEFTVDGTNAVEIEVKVARGGSISGKVMKPNGAPVADVPVRFIAREGGGPFMAQFTATTNSEGVYKVEHLPAGDYLVAAATEIKSANVDIRARLRGETQLVTWHPAAIALRDASPVRVDPGRETGGVNITLVVRKTFSVAGNLLRQRDGSAISGATIVLANNETEVTGPLVPGMLSRTTRTDDEGRWSFSNVAEGSYVVTALEEPSQPGRILRGGMPVLGERSGDPRQTFTVTRQEIVVASDLSGISLAMTGPGTIVGIVKVEDGAPLPDGLVIFLELTSEGDRPSRPLPVRVEPDGSFNVKIQGGEMFLSAALLPDSKYFVKEVTAKGEDLRRRLLSVTEGAEAGPVTVVLSKAIASVVGKVVVGSPNQTRRDIVVLLVPVEAELQRFRTTVLATRTGGDGSFAVTGAPGEYYVFAAPRDELPAIITEEFVKARSPRAERVTLKTGEQKRMDINIP